MNFLAIASGYSSNKWSPGIFFILILLVGCSTSKETAKTQTSSTATMKLPDTQKLAPGTALVRVSVTEGKENDSSPKQVWTLEIKEILGYGAATPPLGAGKKVDADVTTYLKNTSNDPQKVIDQKEVVCMIRHRQMLAGYEGAEWSLVEVFE